MHELAQQMRSELTDNGFTSLNQVHIKLYEQC